MQFLRSNKSGKANAEDRKIRHAAAGIVCVFVSRMLTLVKYWWNGRKQKEYLVFSDAIAYVLIKLSSIIFFPETSNIAIFFQ